MLITICSKLFGIVPLALVNESIETRKTLIQQHQDRIQQWIKYHSWRSKHDSLEQELRHLESKRQQRHLEHQITANVYQLRTQSLPVLHSELMRPPIGNVQALVQCEAIQALVGQGVFTPLQELLSATITAQKQSVQVAQRIQ